MIVNRTAWIPAPDRTAEAAAQRVAAIDRMNDKHPWPGIMRVYAPDRGPDQIVLDGAWESVAQHDAYWEVARADPPPPPEEPLEPLTVQKVGVSSWEMREWRSPNMPRELWAYRTVYQALGYREQPAINVLEAWIEATWTQATGSVWRFYKPDLAPNLLVVEDAWPTIAAHDNFWAPIDMTPQIAEERWYAAIDRLVARERWRVTEWR